MQGEREPQWEAADLDSGARIPDSWTLSKEIKPREQRPHDSHCGGSLSASPWLG